MGSGTGDDDMMPDDMMPGPGGPSCAAPRMLVPSSSLDDMASRPQHDPATSIVRLRDEHLDPAPHQRAPTTRPLTNESPTNNATTKGPHIHERWGEARKHELSYCINGMPGEDAELEFSYHKTIRTLAATTADWERATGANFIHVAADDTPDQPAVLSLVGNNIVARADCGNEASPYFGVLSIQLGQVEGVSNTVPQRWNDPSLEPANGALTRTILLNSAIVSAFGGSGLFTVLRHELGHMMGFDHEEVNLEGQVGEGCTEPAPRPLTPIDEASVLGTPACPGLADASELSHRDRLSAFLLHHSPRARFETGPVGTGYHYSGTPGGAPEILWHTDGSPEGVLWKPQDVSGTLSFVEEAFDYGPPQPLPPGGWFPNHSEVVIPARLTGDMERFDLLFFGPGPDVADYVVLDNSGIPMAIPWAGNAFFAPIVAHFDGDDLDRDVVYLYRPGTNGSEALVASGAAVSVLTEVPQNLEFSYPIAAPYRGPTFPDDLLWYDPVAGTFTAWRFGSGILNLLDSSVVSQGELGLATGENVPAVGDFNGDGRADVMWHGVSNPGAGLPEITDVLWLSESTADALAFATVPKEVGHTYRPFVGDFDGDGIDDIFWHRSWGMTSEGPSISTTGPSFIWYFDALGGHEAEAFVLDADYSPYVSDFDADGCHDIAWFDAVGDTLTLWRCLPLMRDFDCGDTFPTPPNAAPVGTHWAF